MKLGDLIDHLRAARMQYGPDAEVAITTDRVLLTLTNPSDPAIVIYEDLGS